MTKKKVVTVSMKPTHFSASSVKKISHRTSQGKPKKSGSINQSSHSEKSSQKPINKTQNQAQPPRFNYRLLTYHPLQDDAGIVIKLFYDSVFFQQVIVMKSVFEVWSRANLDQKRQFVANQLNPALFGNKANIVWNVCNVIVEYVDAVVARHIAQELAKQQAQRRR